MNIPPNNEHIELKKIAIRRIYTCAYAEWYASPISILKKRLIQHMIPMHMHANKRMLFSNILFINSSCFLSPTLLDNDSIHAMLYTLNIVVYIDGILFAAA